MLHNFQLNTLSISISQVKSPMANKNTLPEEADGSPQLISLKEAAEISGFTPRHIRRLAQTGKIYAKRMGRDWFTTKNSIQEYLTSNRRPGPKT